jgi:two-component system, LytTR family, response regulator
LVATTTSAIEGLQMVNSQAVELVFLDIQMPDLTGVDFIKAIGKQCKVVFITAYNQYAVEGYDLDVVDYLLKPVPFPRFMRAAQKAKEMIDAIRPKHPAQPSALDFIMVNGDSKGKFIKIELDEIDYIEGMGNYVAIFCTGRKVLALMNMKDLEDSLPKDKFMRVHKSFIVSIMKIASIDGNIIHIKQNPKAEIIIGKAYREPFLEAIKTRMIT